MNILQLCNKAPYPSNDGSSIAICSLANGLLENNNELHILTINTKKHYKPDENIPDDFKDRTHYQSVYKNTNTSLFGFIFNLFSKHSYFVSRFFFNSFSNELVKKLSSNTFDVVQLEGVFMALYIPLIKKHSSAKIVLRAHNVEHQIWERHIKNEKNIFKAAYLKIQNKRLKRYELSIYNQVDAIVSITNEDRKNISNLSFNKNIYTALTGVDLKKYNPAFEVSEPNTLFHFASMDWMPNIESLDWFLNEVFNELLQQFPKVKLVVAGRGMPERFKKMASENLIVMEQIDNSELFYHSYDLMMVPLWSGSGLRIKLVEGLAYGKPIVTTSIGAEGIDFINGKHMLIADSKDEFIKAIIALLSDATYKKDLQKNARLLAEECFDYKLIGADLTNFYKTL